LVYIILKVEAILLEIPRDIQKTAGCILKPPLS